jgi:hypothetical protein
MSPEILSIMGRDRARIKCNQIPHKLDTNTDPRGQKTCIFP